MQADILDLIYAAIDEVNAESEEGAKLEKGPDVRLLGGAGSIDSLTFVNLIVAVEEQIQRTLKTSVVLVNEDSMGRDQQAFRSVGSLARHVEALLAAQPK